MHVSTSAAKYSAAIRRVGAEPKLVWSEQGLPGPQHPTPADASLRGCGWPVAVRVPVAANWKSGVYSLELCGEGPAAAAKTETFFIVRAAEPGQRARILFQLSTNTYQAYNAWGGTCLYSGPSHPRTSFDRPFIITPPVTTPVANFYNPNNACYRTWMLDLSSGPSARDTNWNTVRISTSDRSPLAPALSPGVERRARRVLVRRHGPTIWKPSLPAAAIWPSCPATASAGKCGSRIRGCHLVCYKRAHDSDPVFATDDRRTRTTLLWSDPLVRRPENQLTGVGFPFGGYNAFFGEFTAGPGAGQYVTHRPEHRLFAGTGLERGETFGQLQMHGPQPGIAGYECDGCEFSWQEGVPVATGCDGTPAGFEILAT